MDHPALGVIIPGLVEAACQTVLEANRWLVLQLWLNGFCKGGVGCFFLSHVSHMMIKNILYIYIYIGMLTL